MALPTVEHDAGTTTFVSLNGVLNRQQTRVRVLERDGIDGFSAIDLGKKALPSTFIGLTHAASKNDLESLIASLSLVQGQIVSMTDEFGNEHDNLLCEQSEPVGSPRAIGTNVGAAVSNATHELTWRFVFRDMNLP